GTNTSAAGGGGAWTGSPLEDPNSPLYEKVVYFDFDTAEIRPEYVDTLRAHAEYLVNTPSARLVIEGHCDERGSREYNIALGERRADSVKRFLEAEGVSPVQLETVSYGEERPVDLGHNEEAWAKNRRAELVYQ
ncbi:peptidoglycan-associated lipoprotein Pal, partial [Thiolapillus sp.]